MNRKLVSAAVLSFLGVAAYAVWLGCESRRATQGGWTEVTDPA